MPGRNDPCPCGSGKKYKKCCLLKEMQEQAEGQQEEAEKRRVIPAESFAPPPAPARPSAQAGELDSLYERAQELVMTLSSAAYEDKWEILDSLLGDEPEVLDGKFIFEVGSMLMPTAV